MKEGFETGLRQVSEAERMRQGEIELGEGIDNIYVEIEDRLAEMMSDQGVDGAKIEGIGKKILEIQRKKLKIMDKLRGELSALSGSLPESFESHNENNKRSVDFDEERNSFSYHDEKGQVKEATFGEILTDLDWGIEYGLNNDNVPILYRKRYLVEKAKADLRELLDRQILITELNSAEIDDRLKNTYQSIFDKNEARRKGVSDENSLEQAGFVAEKMVQNFLKQLSVDCDLPFSVKVADVQQDVELKMDFIIHKKHNGIGVEIDTGDYEDVAIQYSINQDKEKIKQRQIKRAERRLAKDEVEIKHIALVVFPIEDLNKITKEWKKLGRQAGGPGKLMSKEVKEKLFFALLRDLFTQTEIENFWEKVNQD